MGRFVDLEDRIHTTEERQLKKVNCPWVEATISPVGLHQSRTARPLQHHLGCSFSPLARSLVSRFLEHLEKFDSVPRHNTGNDTFYVLSIFLDGRLLKTAFKWSTSSSPTQEARRNS